MPDHPEYHQHPWPFVDETLTSKTLYFSDCDIQSRMQIGRPDLLLLEYTRLMMGFVLLVPRPGSIAMVGLGGGSLAKFCYRYLPKSRIEVIEINPHVIALRDKFEVPKDDHRFHVHEADAADFVRTAQCRYDVILVDGFDSDGLPACLASRTFYDNCFDLLEPHGVLVANFHFHDQNSPTYMDRMKRSFEGRMLTAINDHERSNTVAFACRDRLAGTLLHGPLHCPPYLAPEAWAQLAPSLSRVKEAARRQRPEPPLQPV
jgi:spermidine synthase